MYQTLILVLHHIGCKNRCVFCGEVKYVSKKIADQIAEIELKKLDYPKVNKNINSVIISGNDPIEYYNFVDFLKKIKKVTDVGIFLQSHCIDFENIDYLKTVLDVGNITSVQVPIYGHTPKVHDAITQNPGSFKSVIKALDNFKKLNFKNIQLHTLILKQNEDYFLKLFSFLLKFNYKIDVSLVCIPSFRGRYIKRRLNNIPNLDKVSTCFKKMKEKFKSNLDKIFLHDIPPCIAPFNFTNINFRSKYSYKGYEHFKNRKIDTVIVNKEIIPEYRVLLKDKKCKKCVLDNICFGITKPYIDLGLFKAKPFSVYMK